MRHMISIIIALLLSGMVLAEDHVKLNEAGNTAFNEGEFEQALDYYRQAEMARPETPGIYYNEANALIETGKYETAVEKYERALNSDDISLQASAYYNGGTGYFMQEDYQKAVEWYQKALELNPDDMDAKYNLELARNRLREQMEKQPQDNQEQQKQDEQNQEEQQEKQQQEQQQEQDQEQQKQQEQQQQPQAGEESEEEEQQQQQEMQPQPQNPEEMSKEDALRILNALRDADADNQKKQKRFKVTGKYKGNDW